MARQKYDWQALKLEFISSDFNDVKSFLDSKWMLWKVSSKWTNWRAKDKKEYQDKILARAIEKKARQEAKQLEVPAELCLANIKKSIELSAVKLQQMEDKKTINTKDLSNIRAMNRIQNNMPTTFVKSENENIEKIEAIHIVIWVQPIDSKKKD